MSGDVETRWEWDKYEGLFIDSNGRTLDEDTLNALQAQADLAAKDADDWETLAMDRLGKLNAERDLAAGLRAALEYIDVELEQLRPFETWETLSETFAECHRKAQAVLNSQLHHKTPIPMILYCPMCCYQHLDEGEWATRPHRTHQCQHCSHEWRAANVATVGVAALQPHHEGGEDA